MDTLRPVRTLRYECPVVTCIKWFELYRGLTLHLKRTHGLTIAQALAQARSDGSFPTDTNHSSTSSTSAHSSTAMDIDKQPVLDQDSHFQDDGMDVDMTPLPTRDDFDDDTMDVDISPDPEIYCPSHTDSDHIYWRDGDEGLVEEEPDSLSTAPPPRVERSYHPHLTGKLEKLFFCSHSRATGAPCDAAGTFLEPDSPPSPRINSHPERESHPFPTIKDFLLAEFLFSKAEMSASNINILLALLAGRGNPPAFASARHMYQMIDSIEHGDAPWERFHVTYQGERGIEYPSWQAERFEVYYRNPDTIIKSMLDNPEFDGLLDYQPYKEFTANGKRRYGEFMSGHFGWTQAVCAFSAI
jgi:hypothetical protein